MPTAMTVARHDRRSQERQCISRARRFICLNRKKCSCRRRAAGVMGLNHDDAEESSRKPLHRARLFFPDEQPQGRTRKPVSPTDLVLKKAKVRSSNIFRMADEERKDRRRSARCETLARG